MKSKKFFLVILFITLLLILLCIWIDRQKSVKHERLDVVEKIVSVPMSKGLIESQTEIDLLLRLQPILFSKNSVILEDNRTVENIISILRRTKGDIAVQIISHSDSNGLDSDNRKLSQKRADMLHAYIKERYDKFFIYAIGYGEEYPLSKEQNQTSERIEIHLKRIVK